VTFELSAIRGAVRQSQKKDEMKKMGTVPNFGLPPISGIC